ncbi:MULTISPECIES: hypothetical protein [Halorhodospira]|uniref:DUF6414 family protein n=1 Tax=Halorhodospira TaxID=85108 RepID=UPI001EE82E89|nr:MULTISPECIES: hypothetical protein [Halorhodospira]MCG5529077.1 hypothetical protein [Halorhodospira halophila]MCG5543192.1 hypothetical protein [Halorhodospira sp. 9628]
MNDLIVPVYLNQRMVFDLLAMLQGGISTVTAVTKQEGGESGSVGTASASVGLNEALSSLFKIGLTAEVETSDKSSNNFIQEERVYTPASLFYQLRTTLSEKNLLQKIDEGSCIKAGEIVEFTVKLKRNPIIEIMDTLTEMMSMAVLFEDKPSSNGKGGKTGKGKPNENAQIKKQMEEFSQALKSGNTVDLTASDLPSGHKAVITVESLYLNDPVMSDLVDGEFKVVGKVVRSIGNSSESINLIRKTSLSRMPSHILEHVFQQFAALGTIHGFDIPERKMEIEEPAIQVLPIAIYA